MQKKVFFKNSKGDNLCGILSDPFDSRDSLIAVPTLIVHGDADESVSLQDSQKLAAKLPDCRLEIIEGADHRYSRPEDFEMMLGLISAFVFKHSSASE